MNSPAGKFVSVQTNQPASIPQQSAPPVTPSAPKQSKSSQSQQMPLFWELLNDHDKEDYLKMRIALSSPACKHRRHHSSELNREIVNTIKNYVIRNDGDDWKRALVSGIVWLPNAIAINTRQLCLLISKCKSSINALFQNMGYVTIPTTNDYSSSLVSVFPLLKDNFGELRKWTIRLVGSTQQQLVNKQQNASQHRQQQMTGQINPILPQQILQPQPQFSQPAEIEKPVNQTENPIEVNINQQINIKTENSSNISESNVLTPIQPVVASVEKVEPSTLGSENTAGETKGE